MVFVGSRLLRNPSCYDPYWSVLPPFLVVLVWAITYQEVVDRVPRLVPRPPRRRPAP